MSITINKLQGDGKITLALKGRLDTSTASQLQDELIPALDEASQIEVDLEKIDYVSSAGLRVLLMGQKKANSKGAAMTVSYVSDEIMEIFEMTGFQDILTIV